jgi:hypothetical protein
VKLSQVPGIPFCAFRTQPKDGPFVVALTWTNCVHLRAAMLKQFSVTVRRLHSL